VSKNFGTIVVADFEYEVQPGELPNPLCMVAHVLDENLRHVRTIRMWRDLLDEHGIYTNPFISPGVPPKSAMLRTSYMATHERSHLDRALEAFRTVGKKYGVIQG